MAHYQRFRNYETVRGSCIDSKHQKNAKLRWLAAEINFKLLNTRCPIAHELNYQMGLHFPFILQQIHFCKKHVSDLGVYELYVKILNLLKLPVKI